MSEIYHIDEIDRRIISALQQDGTISQAALAEHAGASPASCWRRIRALEKAGVLGPTVRLVDPASVGKGVNVLCQVRMQSHARQSYKSFEDFVQEHGEIVECHSMSGEWDYLLRIVVRDVADYERFLMRTLLQHPAVATASSHFALNQVKYTTVIPV